MKFIDPKFRDLRASGVRECCIFDLDGTIADVRHRRPFITGGRKDWKAFRAAMDDDTPMVPIVNVFHALQTVGYAGVICSGRHGEDMERTRVWLAKWAVSYDALYMRPLKDNRPDVAVKRDLLEQIIADGFRPTLVCDDRDRLVEMWRAQGLVCLQAAPGAF